MIVGTIAIVLILIALCVMTFVIDRNQGVEDKNGHEYYMPNGSWWEV